MSATNRAASNYNKMKIPIHIKLVGPPRGPKKQPSGPAATGGADKAPPSAEARPAGADVRAVDALFSALGKQLASVATSTWRMRSRLWGQQDQEPVVSVTPEDIKRLQRSVDAIFTALKEAGVEIRDRTGEPFDYGLPEKVVATKQKQGINKELVSETLLPTIYWRDCLVQKGEVILSTPTTESNK